MNFIRISTLLLILMCTSCIKLCFAAANITCEFSVDDGKYTVKITNQTYRVTDRGIKIYGRHLNRMKNNDVLILDASNRGNNLEIAPSILFQIFANLMELRMENCGLKQLTANSFKYCSSIKLMKFGVDKIEIESEAFRACKNLEVLEFNRNEIQKLDEDAFEGLENLKILKIHNSNLLIIEPTLFMPLINLEELHLTGNKINEISVSALQDMTQLKVMNFSDNDLTTFSSSHLERKNHLLFLDLSRNNISYLEENFLEEWQNNAALNLESNACVDKNFGRIGTNEMPLFDVVDKLKDCFKEPTAPLVTVKNVTDDSSSYESESFESILEEMGINETENVKQNMDVMKIDEDKIHKLNSTNESVEIKPVDNLEDGTTEIPNRITKDEGSVEDMTDSPFDFAKESANNDGDLKQFNVDAKNATVTKDEDLNIPVVNESSFKNEANDGDELKNFAAEETILKIKANTTIELQYHDYEQATCRFYIDADKNYNCELMNVTNQLKKINVNHLGSYTNANVSGVFFRNSKLFQVPKVITQTFPNIELLSIEKTNLKVMDDEFIEECGNIRQINLRNNKIRRVERNSLKACLYLENVDLSKNPIETIEGGVFECNPKLTFTFNDLKILPAHSTSNDDRADSSN